MQPSAFDFRNLAQEPDDNLGGVEALWYARAADLLYFDPLSDLPIAQLELVPGAFWYQLVSTRGTVRYKQTPKALGRHGDSHTQKVVGTLARHTAELARGLEALERQQLVVLYRDYNGQVQLLGTPEQPLAWSDAYDSGDQAARNNYDWTLSGETPRRARPYLGTWLVSGVGLVGSIELGGGSGGSIEIRDARGNLLAIVPAGRTVVLRSGFRVAYSII
ncbi:hypothetical protein QMK33_19305 [Hymenobacter sp. H14-R3]|uniref:hypothetical protein n=1 Tax=Hymenobacter sp. H14-R3 TaxID=3046308 RepID=UPI0024BB14C5|nr:hypothetical protein [Hymenobacter sp. H14-R3]MDJ0367301.1 hypothetical protein [Hymenobacter sp. H14-R3]